MRSCSASVSMISRVCIWPPMQRSAAADKHAFRRAADAEIDIDAGLGFGAVNDARHVAVADQR